MPLSAGQSLSFYEILGPLGAGAMGEVYRAKDTRLERDVAIKVLPEHFADDEERLRRFEREARTLASLNHQNVAGIHGIDQVDDTCFLAMELVPGDDLAERLQRGPLPVEEALDVCRQIAEGLEVAHEAGVVHRDLKPANVRITPDGVVKLLDFGLAKPIHPRATREGTTSVESDSFLVTSEGLVLGTPTYMSPEQARGKPVDRRTDIWAFGCVLYECLTGKRAFEGEAFGDLIAAILEHEVDFDALPARTPPHVCGLLQRALTKDARRRLRDIGEARLALEDPEGAAWGLGGFAAGAAAAADDGAARAGASDVNRGLRVVLAVLLLVLGALAARGLLGTGDTPVVTGPMYLSIEPPADTTVHFSGDLAAPPVVSPDGRMIAFGAATEDEPRRLWLRSLDAPEARPLPGTEKGLFPFWSPDSRELGFFSDGVLRRYDLGSDTITDVIDVGPSRGGAFTGDGRIVYTPNFRSGLFVVDANGGDPVPLTTLGDDGRTSHRWPSVIPGTDRFLYLAVTATLGAEVEDAIYLGRLDGSEPPQLVVPSSYGAQALDGQLLHVKGDTVLAQPFDPLTGELEDTTVALARGVAPDPSTWHAQFSASPAGVLAINRVPRPGQEDGVRPHSFTLSGDRVSHWTREGRLVTTYGSGIAVNTVSVRPDGWMLAVDALSPDGFTDIWLYPTLDGPEFRQGSDPASEPIGNPEPQRLTFLPGPEFLPVWSPDGEEVAFRWVGDDERPRGIYRKRIGGGSEVLVRDNQGGDDHPSAWSPDGKYLIVTTGTMLASPLNDIVAVPLDGGPEIPLVTAPGPQSKGQVSPDGRWLAYCDTVKRGAVFVVPFAPAWPEDRSAERWLVSDNGGYEPRWSPWGNELFYVTDTGTLISVEVDTSGESFTFGTPTALFQSPWRLDRSYSPYIGPTPDSVDRAPGFMFVDSGLGAEGPISVVLGWQALVGED